MVFVGLGLGDFWRGRCGRRVGVSWALFGKVAFCFGAAGEVSSVMST